MKEILQINNLEITLTNELTKEFLLDSENIKKIQDGIEGLTKNVYDFSTEKGIKEAKELKTKANRFVKRLKEFCEPLEAEGKKVADARSTITQKLVSGKDNVIDRILAPVIIVEDKLKQLKAKLFTISQNAQENLFALEEVKQFENFEWLAYKDEAQDLVSKQKAFLENEKIKFDQLARLAAAEEEFKRDVEKKEMEERIKKEAEELANRKAQEVIAKIEREKKEAEELAKRQELLQKQEQERKEKDIESQKRVHNEILDDLKEKAGLSEDLSKQIISLIAKKEIRNLSIKY